MIAMIRSLVPVLAAALLVGCGGSLFTLNLDIVGERTALEQQVLGTYEALGTDLTSFASVRAVQPDGSLELPPPMTESQRGVMMALNNRRYNRDDLDALLTFGVLGEANTGLVVWRDEAALQGTNIDRGLAEQIFEEENRDRAVILERLVRTTPGVTPAQEGAVGWIFATLNQDLAPAGSPVQNEDGTWRQK